MSLNFLASIVLAFSHDLILIPIIILGFIFGKRSHFYQLFCLLCLSLLINISLKLYFHVPLTPTLHKEGFAFPSGHMQMSSVFYGYLAYRLQSLTLSLILLVVLVGIGWALVYFGYHTIADVIAGFISAVIILSCYCLTTQRALEKTLWSMLIIASSLMAYLVLYYPYNFSNAGLAYLLLCSLVLSEKYWFKER